MFIGIIELAQYFIGKKKKSIGSRAAIKEYTYTIILVLCKRQGEKHIRPYQADTAIEEETLQIFHCNVPR